MGAACSRRRHRDSCKRSSSINVVDAAAPWPPTGILSSETMAKGLQEDAEDDAPADESTKLSRVLSVRAMTSTAATRVLGAFDTLGSSVTSTFTGNPRTTRSSCKIGILSFEVANTIVRGCNLKDSLTEDEMKVLEEETLNSDGVQLLVSTDYSELMRIAARDKRCELKGFVDEVVRFGNQCRDPQWHHLDRVFNRLVREDSVPRQSQDEARRVMDELMALAQITAELYHELLALDRFQIDLKRKQQEEELCFAGRGAAAVTPEETVTLLRSEVRSQERHVKALKRRSLWAKILEEVMEQLVDVVYYLYQEINDKFGPEVFLELEPSENGYNGKLGASGLALHYANIINQIDTLATRPSSVPSNARDTLYQGLPPAMKSALRVRLQQKSSKDELTTDELKGELYKVLDWLVPVASNTTKAHHGFGWVGEWANTGSLVDRKAMGYGTELTLLQTLHHADQQKVETYILDLIVTLHLLVTRARKNKSAKSTTPQKPTVIRVRLPAAPFVPPERNISPPPFQMLATHKDQSDAVPKQQVQRAGRKLVSGLSKSQEMFEFRTERDHVVLNKSNSHSPSTAKKLEFDQVVHKPTLIPSACRLFSKG